MKLLFFIPSLRAGGAERVTANLANHWTQKGWQITIVTLSDFSQDFYKLNPLVHRISLNLEDESVNIFSAISNNYKRVKGLRRILLSDPHQIGIGMMSTAGVLLILASLFLPKMTVIASERIYPPMLPLGLVWNLLRQWLYPWASDVTVLSSESLKWLNSEIPRAHGVIIPNHIEHTLTITPPIIQPDSIISVDRKILLAVGRFDNQKGFDTLIKVFGGIAKKVPEWDLVILGEGGLRQALESEIQNLNMKNRVYLPGRVGNVSDWYSRSDLYVLSSRFEGFPNTLAEAMAHGCAVVSFDCDTGPRDIIRNEIDGILIPNRDVTKMSSELLRLMTHDALRQTLSSRAVEVRERYSIERISTMWETVFHKHAK